MLERSKQLLERSKERLRVLQDATAANSQNQNVQSETEIKKDAQKLSSNSESTTSQVSKPPRLAGTHVQDPDADLENQFDSLASLSAKMRQIHKDFITSQSAISNQQSKAIHGQTLEQIQFIQQLQDTQLSYVLNYFSPCFQLGADQSIPFGQILPRPVSNYSRTGQRLFSRHVIARGNSGGSCKCS